MNTTHVSHPAVIDSDSGAKLANTDKPFILALKKGESLFDSILRCVNAANLKAAMISGLGALDDVTLAYYNLATKQYQTKLFKGTFELISLNGNITFAEGKRFAHIHAAFGAEDYSVIGGHLMKATVGPSAEISIIPLLTTIVREYDSTIGLKLICPLK